MGLPGMVKPMSEPGLQGSPLAFVDGGTLCNFPLHCFDGWWLSMTEQGWRVQETADKALHWETFAADAAGTGNHAH